MRSLLTLLLFCVCLPAAVAQSTVKKATTTAKKTAATAKKSAATAKRTATAAKKTVEAPPRPKPALPPAEPAASTLTFPSTEPENAATLDAQKKQQMYDELHGVKPQSATLDTRSRQRMASNASGEAGSYIGIRVGGNYTTFLERTQIANGLGNFLNTTPPNYFGFHAGVVFQFGQGAVAFQPEINFQQDYTKQFTFIPGETRAYTTSSLVVPLLAKFQFGQPGNTRLFVNVGPYGSYSLDSRNTSTVIGYGGALGVGVGIPAGPGKFTVEARSYYALGATNSNVSFGNVPNKPLLNQLSVGYLFPLGNR